MTRRKSMNILLIYVTRCWYIWDLKTRTCMVPVSTQKQKWLATVGLWLRNTIRRKNCLIFGWNSLTKRLTIWKKKIRRTCLVLRILFIKESLTNGPNWLIHWSLELLLVWLIKTRPVQLPLWMKLSRIRPVLFYPLMMILFSIKVREIITGTMIFLLVQEPSSWSILWWAIATHVCSISSRRMIITLM